MADYETNRDLENRDTSNDDRYRPDETPRVAALSDLDDFEVADGYPDPRGWRVLTAEGTEVGKVHDLIVDTGTMRTRYLDVKLDHDKLATAGTRRDDDWDALIPVGSAQLAENDDEVMLPSLSTTQLAALPVFEHGEITRDYENSVLAGVGGAAAGAAATTDRDYYDRQHFDDRRFFGRQAAADVNADARNTVNRDVENRDTDSTRRIPLAEEELDISKRKVQAGEATVHKTVETEHVTRPVTLTREEVTIERRPVSGREASNASIGKDDSEIRIPLMSEEAVVNKRPVVKEEIVISKHAVTENKNVEADLRKEQVDIDKNIDKNTDRNVIRDSGEARNP